MTSICCEPWHLTCSRREKVVCRHGICIIVLMLWILVQQKKLPVSTEPCVHSTHEVWYSVSVRNPIYSIPFNISFTIPLYMLSYLEICLTLKKWRPWRVFIIVFSLCIPNRILGLSTVYYNKYIFIKDENVSHSKRITDWLQSHSKKGHKIFLLQFAHLYHYYSINHALRRTGNRTSSQQSTPSSPMWRS